MKTIQVFAGEVARYWPERGETHADAADRAIHRHYGNSASFWRVNTDGEWRCRHGRITAINYKGTVVAPRSQAAGAYPVLGEVNWSLDFPDSCPDC